MAHGKKIRNNVDAISNSNQECLLDPGMTLYCMLSVHYLCNLKAPREDGNGRNRHISTFANRSQTLGGADAWHTILLTGFTSD
jgi:hypothetical protein